MTMEVEIPQQKQEANSGTPKSLLLGLFICLQLTYWITANTLQFFPRSKLSNNGKTGDQGELLLDPQKLGSTTAIAPLQGLINLTGQIFDSWGEATGQFQCWKMFCPKLPAESIFPVVEIEFEDGTKEIVDSDYQQLGHYLRLPKVDFHEHHVESNIIVGLWTISSNAVENEKESVSETYQFWAWFRPKSLPWLFEKYAANTRSKAKAKQAILYLRYISKKPKDIFLDDRKFVRYQFDSQVIEVYDLKTEQFVPKNLKRTD